MLLTPLRALTETLFPTTCWANPAALDAPGALSAPVRFQIAQLAAQPYCHHCGLTTGPFTAHDKSNPCARCPERPLSLARIARVGTFSEPLITLIHRLKFSKSWELAPILAPFLYQAILQVAERSETPVDVLLPIPLHWSRHFSRGFNQSEELARALANISHWPLRTALRRIKRTAAQATLQARTRRHENLHHAFLARPDPHIAGKHVWLLDDVSTTGATLHAAATALRKLPKSARPVSINAAVLCITDHRSPPAEGGGG